MHQSRRKTFIQTASTGSYSLVLYIFLALIVRIFTYSPSVIDSDESTYIIIADALLKGHAPYLHYIDIKPVGIFLLFAPVLAISGGSIFAIRIFAALVIGLTGWLISRCFKKLPYTSGSESLALLAGILYILAGSLHKWSWPANTEIFFCFFTGAGLYTLLSARRGGGYFLFGLLLGCGFMVKYLVLMDYAAFAAFAFFYILLTRSIVSRIAILSLSFLGFVLPFILTASWYAINGHWELFYNVTFAIPSAYREQASSGDILGFMGEFYGSLLPLSIAYFTAVYLLLKKVKAKVYLYSFVLLWPILIWTGIILTGKLFFHYYFQALLPLCLFTPLVFELSAQLKKSVFSFMSRYWFPILLGCIAMILFNQKNQLPREDLPSVISKDLRKELREGDNIYVQYRNIIYYLTDREAPGKFPHTSIFLYPELSSAYGIDLDDEYNLIFAGEPRFCIIENPPAPQVRTRLVSDYFLKKIYREKVFLWERKRE